MLSQKEKKEKARKNSLRYYQENKEVVKAKARSNYYKNNKKNYNRGYKDGIFQTALFSGIVLVSVVAIWISSNYLLNQKLEDSEKRAEKRIEYWIEQYENKGVK